MKAGKEIVRSVTDGDHEVITHIYNHYILNTIVTFEEHELTFEEISGRIQEVLGADLPWLVVEKDGQVVGYAYATRWKGRCAYRFSVEITVYLHPGHAGKGLGTKLYSELFRILKHNGTHVVIGGIALPNEASIALHEKFRMEKAAHFTEVGYKFGRWIDVGYWQRIL